MNETWPRFGRNHAGLMGCDSIKVTIDLDQQSVSKPVVDDHPLFRDGFIAAVQSRLPGIVFGVAGSAREALLHAKSNPPDLVLVDWRLPDGDGLSLLRDIGKLCPLSARVLLSGSDDPRLPGQARAAGLLGYLPKTLEPTLLVHAIERIVRGESFFPDAAATRAAAVLTARQHEILILVSRGMTSKEIARALVISERTVKDHIALIFDRLGAVNRADAISRAVARGLF
ncbi:MAG: two component LuxR family transcriptional regulator [Comamonadaceae bacterium]|nr:MAG: two component LuxR family transcriptional regulator [Comamonadaceae bacterium]